MSTLAWNTQVLPQGLALLDGGTITAGEGVARLLPDQATGDGYPCTCWPKTYSGGGCARASPSGMAATGGFVPGRRAAGQADPWRLGRRAEVVENPRHGGGLRDEGGNARVGAAVRAD